MGRKVFLASLIALISPISSELSLLDHVESSLYLWRRGDILASREIIDSRFRSFRLNNNDETISWPSIVLIPLIDTYCIQGRWTDAQETISNYYLIHNRSNLHLTTSLSPRLCTLFVLLALGSHQIADNAADTCSKEAWSNHLTSYLSHDTLWLVASEAQYLVEKHGSMTVFKYTVEAATAAGKHLKGPMDQHDNDQMIEQTRLLIQFVDSLGSVFQHTPPIGIGKDALELHSKLAVFFDEMGDGAAAARHNRLFLLASRAVDPTAHTLNFGALIPRSLLASDPLFWSKEDLQYYRARQSNILTALYDLSPFNDKVNYTFCAYLLSFERHFTTTPPSMMIGYEWTPFDSNILLKSNLLIPQFSPPILPFIPSQHLSRSNVSRLVRVAFLSCFFYNHSVGRLINSLIIALARQPSLEVFVISLTSCTGYRDDNNIAELRAAVNNYIRLPNADSGHHSNVMFINRTVSLLRNLELDAIVFPELGMDDVTMAIARHRSAPSQIVFWGHPISQRLHSIDYAISSILFEEDALNRGLSTPWSERRSEQVLLLEGLTVPLKPPVFDDKISSSEEVSAMLRLNLNATRIYLLPHTVMKYSTDFDKVILEILQIDTSGVILLLYSPAQMLWFDRLIRRIAFVCRAGPFSFHCDNLLDRLLLRPKLQKKDYIALLKQSAVVIDSYPFGMGVTALEAFSLGVPVVSSPELQKTIRLVSAMVCMMNVTELLTDRSQNLAELAVRVANDGPFRESVLLKLQKSWRLLFMENAATNDWKRILLALSA